MNQQLNTVGANEIGWLFRPRVSLTEPQEVIRQRITNQELLKILHHNQEKVQVRFQKPFQNQKELQYVVETLNAIIYQLRFNEKNIAKNAQKSKKDLKGKKGKHFKDRVKKAMNYFDLDLNMQEEEHWTKVLNHRNVIYTLQKLYQILSDILRLNFVLIKKLDVQGDNQQKQKQQINILQVTEIKESCLPQGFQIKISILVIDLLTLINNLKFAFIPYSSEEIQNYLMAKQERKIMTDSLRKSDFSICYETLEKLRIQTFSVIILKLTEGSSKEQMIYKLWSDIFEVKKKFLITDSGLWKKQFNIHMILIGIQEIANNWEEIQDFLLKQDNAEEIKHEKNLIYVFQEYHNLFRYVVKSGKLSEEQQMQGIFSFLYLSEKIWTNISVMGKKIYWNQLQEIVKQKNIQVTSLKVNIKMISKIGIESLEQSKNKKSQEIKQSLVIVLADLSTNLINLDVDEDLTLDYFNKNRGNISEILTNWSLYLCKYEKSLQQWSQVNEQNMTEKMSNLHQMLQEKQNQANQSSINLNINKLLSQLNDNLNPEQEDFIKQIECFMYLSQSFTQTIDRCHLEYCKNFYQEKREKILNNNQNFSGQNINQNKFGIMDSIKVTILELVVRIKLDKKKSLHEKINQNQLSQRKQHQKIEHLIYKLLRVYLHKVNNLMREEELSKESNLRVPLLLRKSSSYHVDPQRFFIQDDDSEILDETSQQTQETFILNVFKKIYELKVEAIHSNLDSLEELEKPWRTEYEEIMAKSFQLTLGHQSDQTTREAIKSFPSIEYDFVRKKYYPAWRSLIKLIDQKISLEKILQILQCAQGGKISILKLFVTLLQKYRKYQQITRNQSDQIRNQKKIDEIIKECLQQKDRFQYGKDRPWKQDLRRSIRILSGFQTLTALRQQRREQQQKQKAMEEMKHFSTIKKNTQFKQLKDCLQIIQVKKNDTPIMKRYVIKTDGMKVKQIVDKLNQLVKFNRAISFKVERENKRITMEVDEKQVNFDSYPKLVSYLIEFYLQIITFCKDNLHFKLYPLIKPQHIKILKKRGAHIPLRFDPYEGILLQILIGQPALKNEKLHKYPQFPFVEFAIHLQEIMTKGNYKIYQKQKANSQLYTFKHLIEQIKALSFQDDEYYVDNAELVKKILKCPYFWSSADKLFELVYFKEKYQSNINIQQSRRKKNQKQRKMLPPQQDFTHLSQHPLYKRASPHNITTQFYFSIQGLLQKQANVEDIGNFRGNNHDFQYKFESYFWYNGIPKIQDLIEKAAARQKKNGSKKATFWKKTFPSFQNQMRNLRNLAAHYIYDEENKTQIYLEDKLNLFQEYFPKLFIFLFRWRSYLGKNYNQIKQQKVRFLTKLFPKDKNVELIKRLQDIKQLQDYNIKNTNSQLFKRFNYSKQNQKDCKVCQYLCLSMQRQASLWRFLSDLKKQDYKEGNDNSFNILFWAHDKRNCNGLQYLEYTFFSVEKKKRQTSEQNPSAKSSYFQLKIEKQRIENRMRKITQRGRQMGNDNKKIQMMEEESQSDQQKNNIQSKKQKQKFKQLNATQKSELQNKLQRTDYVCKYFIFQLEMQFPHLFRDLRNERYNWDQRAHEYPQ